MRCPCCVVKPTFHCRRPSSIAISSRSLRGALDSSRWVVAVIVSAPFRMGILERSLTVATHLTSSGAFQPPCILSYGRALPEAVEGDVEHVEIAQLAGERDVRVRIA